VRRSLPSQGLELGPLYGIWNALVLQSAIRSRAQVRQIPIFAARVVSRRRLRPVPRCCASCLSPETPASSLRTRTGHATAARRGCALPYLLNRIQARRCFKVNHDPSGEMHATHAQPGQYGEPSGELEVLGQLLRSFANWSCAWSHAAAPPSRRYIGTSGC